MSHISSNPEAYRAAPALSEGTEGFRKLAEDTRKNAFNYKNLQPLWAIENLKKGNLWIIPHKATASGQKDQ